MIALAAGLHEGRVPSEADDYHGGLALPPTIPCKVSSESVGYVTTSAVARRDLPTEELASKILAVCGKNPDRIARILAQGSLVSGDVRYRWVPLTVSAEDLDGLLDRFPDHDPRRPFEAADCVRMVFRGDHGDFEITREAGLQRRLFRRKTFWDEAVALIQPLGPVCARYSYSDRADVFTVQIPPIVVNRLRGLCSLLRFTALGARIRSLRPGQIALHVPRNQ